MEENNLIKKNEKMKKTLIYASAGTFLLFLGYKLYSSQNKKGTDKLATTTPQRGAGGIPEGAIAFNGEVSSDGRSVELCCGGVRYSMPKALALQIRSSATVIGKCGGRKQ